MKLIELIRAIGYNAHVRIAVFDRDMEKHTIVGEMTARGYVELMHRIGGMDCADYTVTQIYCLWHAQELYIECMKL